MRQIVRSALPLGEGIVLDPLPSLPFCWTREKFVFIAANHIEDGKCKFCGEHIPGIRGKE